MSAPRIRVEWGGVAISVLAALSLALTVVVGAVGWDRAEEPLVRGEGASLVAMIHDDIDEATPVQDADLAREILRHRENGLKFVAIVHPGDREARVVARAGDEMIADADLHAGAFARRGARARLVLTLAPPTHRDGPPPGFGDRGAPGFPPPGFPPPGVDAPDRAARPGGPPPIPPSMRPTMPPTMPPAMTDAPLIVIELEPRVTARVSEVIARTGSIAGAAAIVLVFAAVLLSRAIRRAIASEKNAERDQKLVALGRMSAVMAHELRNPLASLKGHAQLLAEMLERDSKEAKKADRVVHEAERLERLTNDLLDFVREKPMSREPVAIADLAREVTKDVAGVHGKVEAEGVASAVTGDAARLSIALGNVIRNALQATEGEGKEEGEEDGEGEARVSVIVREEGDEIVIDISDRGVGVALGEDEKIFEPFVTTRVHGTGLGLAVAREIAVAHGGSLRVENRGAANVKVGATFTLRLPKAR